MTLISQLTQALRLADTALATDGHDAAAQPRYAIHLALSAAREWIAEQGPGTKE